MNDLTTFDDTVIVPLRKHKGELCAFLTKFKDTVRNPRSVSTVYVVPDSGEGLSYLRFATQIYSKLVVYENPCLDVVIPRHSAHDKLLKVTSANSRYGNNNVAQDSLPCLSEHQHDVVTVDCHGYRFGDGSRDFYDKYAVVAVGGTFDRLHAGHRLLLTAAAWATRETLRIGITSDALLVNKKYKEAIASVDERGHGARNFARRVKPSLPCILITELKDSAGPSATDPTIEALVVSAETAAGARTINEKRVGDGLPPMTIIEVDILDTHGRKLSSSALREAEVTRGSENVA